MQHIVTCNPGDEIIIVGSDDVTIRVQPRLPMIDAYGVTHLQPAHSGTALDNEPSANVYPFLEKTEGAWIIY